MDEMQFLLADSEKDFAYLIDDLDDRECFERLVKQLEQNAEWQQ